MFQKQKHPYDIFFIFCIFPSSAYYLITSIFNKDYWLCSTSLTALLRYQVKENSICQNFKVLVAHWYWANRQVSSWKWEPIRVKVSALRELQSRHPTSQKFGWEVRTDYLILNHLITSRAIPMTRLLINVFLVILSHYRQYRNKTVLVS